LLQTNRMILRPPEASDRQALLGAVAASRAELDEFMPLHADEESDDAMFDRHLELAVQAMAQRAAPPYVRLLGVLSDGRIAGGFNINTISRGLEWRADLNWWIATPLAGQGLATEGLAAIVNYALDDLPGGLGLHIVHAWITRDNLASARVAERAGLKRQGEEKSYVSTGGRWVLHDCFARSIAD
jgi:[ribosomal protein S5]-alanine N-acetyltransferase